MDNQFTIQESELIELTIAKNIGHETDITNLLLLLQKISKMKGRLQDGKENVS